MIRAKYFVSHKQARMYPLALPAIDSDRKVILIRRSNLKQDRANKTRFRTALVKYWWWKTSFACHVLNTLGEMEGLRAGAKNT